MSSRKHDYHNLYFDYRGDLRCKWCEQIIHYAGTTVGADSDDVPFEDVLDKAKVHAKELCMPPMTKKPKPVLPPPLEAAFIHEVYGHTIKDQLENEQSLILKKLGIQ